MKKHTWLSHATMAAFVVTMVVAPATSAPMFPDLPQEHWARDAVAALAAKGLVEGYPDGTFKGDRAATRYEVAMIVARLLAKIEQEEATFATKADLDSLRKLVDQLRSELDALGVRVQNLENNVGKLDKRVTELERIRFYGWSDTRFVSQGFQNNGLTLGTGGNVGGALGSPIGFGATNYNAAIGTNASGMSGNFFWGMASQPDGAAGARTNFFGSTTTFAGLPDTGQSGFVSRAVPLVVPVMDLLNGSPLTNGTGFTNTTVLGARIKVSDDVDAGLELSAYVSTGDAIVDAFYGTTAPYLSNQFTGNSGIAGGQGLNNQPFTRMNLDNFWLIHKPSGLKLQVGSFDGTNFDDCIY
ncbi:MAG TPA: S-layer homology domain-containing protein, partial [Candidatus Xenobia bacterium]